MACSDTPEWIGILLHPPDHIDTLYFGDHDADARHAQRYPQHADAVDAGETATAFYVPTAASRAIDAISVAVSIPRFDSYRQAEDWVFELVANAPEGLRALVYRQLYNEGLRISDVQSTIRAYEKELTS
jgi:hypothetical protein